MVYKTERPFIIKIPNDGKIADNEPTPNTNWILDRKQFIRVSKMINNKRDYQESFEYTKRIKFQRKWGCELMIISAPDSSPPKRYVQKIGLFQVLYSRTFTHIHPQPRTPTSSTHPQATQPTNPCTLSTRSPSRIIFFSPLSTFPTILFHFALSIINLPSVSKCFARISIATRSPPDPFSFRPLQFSTTPHWLSEQPMLILDAR